MTFFSSLSECERAELWACLALRHSKGIGASRAKRLISVFGSALSAVNACLSSSRSWGKVPGISETVASTFASEAWRSGAYAEWDAIKRNQYSFLLWNDDAYPHLLRETPDMPLLLYYQGDASLLSNPAVAVVGSRSCTREGVAVAAFFARGLAHAGVTIISGMAKGIDRAAHLAGLEGVGRSIAVLGTGIDVVYPTCNADLARELHSEGLVVSEFAPGTVASPSNFPIRNRIISGLSRGVLVIEAAGRSGSLITARLALEQGRDVFAVPGHTMSTVSAGCRELIRQGAKAVFSADDVLFDLAALLTADAQAALQKRLNAKTNSPVPAKNPLHAPYFEEISDAALVLPDRPIPWFAPKMSQSVAQSSSSRSVAPQKVSSGQQPSRSVEASAAPSKEVRQVSSEKQQSPRTVTTDASFSTDEQALLQVLTEIPQHIDVISRLLAFDIAKVSSLLTMLEIRGCVLRKPGMYYCLSSGM